MLSCCVAFGILVPQPGIEPALLALKTLSPNHWTAPGIILFFFFKILFKDCGGVEVGKDNM